MENSLPPIPAKRYFTISEVGDLCGVKPHVLRYWEQEFTQLRPMKRSGNRRYYQHNEVLMIRRIRELLYDQGFTIHGARNQMQEMGQALRGQKRNTAVSEFEKQSEVGLNGHQGQAHDANFDGANFDADIHDDALEAALVAALEASPSNSLISSAVATKANHFKWQFVRQELYEIRELLGVSPAASPQAMRA
jgi:DNA-binding transcriptional MerR regulator